MRVSGSIAVLFAAACASDPAALVVDATLRDAPVVDAADVVADQRLATAIDAPGCADGAACAGACVDLSFDSANCGACGAVCGLGQTCCGGRCTDVSRNAFDCGRCGAVCAAPHGTARCLHGACGGAGCDPGWRDCDGDARNGCEAVADDAGSCAR